ncbi:Fe superoxide dismutase 3 [Striga asiatica]|uniref:Fe superoxide dismutase 3 n=1 Tax=Striga asiatica TaxID=4170 RepID=A0A5A7QMY8_STRAF|nr:Fe superoxide dismutase 3 [Striga asiatica]
MAERGGDAAERSGGRRWREALMESIWMKKGSSVVRWDLRWGRRWKGRVAILGWEERKAERWVDSAELTVGWTVMRVTWQPREERVAASRRKGRRWPMPEHGNRATWGDQRFAIASMLLGGGNTVRGSRMDIDALDSMSTASLK